MAGVRISLTDSWGGHQWSQLMHLKNSLIIHTPSPSPSTGIIVLEKELNSLIDRAIELKERAAIQEGITKNGAQSKTAGEIVCDCVKFTLLIIVLGTYICLHHHISFKSKHVGNEKKTGSTGCTIFSRNTLNRYCSIANGCINLWFTSSGDKTSTFCVSKYKACSTNTFCFIWD